MPRRSVGGLYQPGSVRMMKLPMVMFDDAMKKPGFGGKLPQNHKKWLRQIECHRWLDSHFFHA